MTYADKPWLKSYKFGPYPLKKTLEPYPEIPLYQILYDSAEKFPDRPACLAFGKETRYSKLKEYVDRLAEGPGMAIGLIKRSVVSGSQMSLHEGLTLERELQNRLFASDDAQEGIQAYLERRKPDFSKKEL